MPIGGGLIHVHIHTVHRRGNEVSSFPHICKYQTRMNVFMSPALALNAAGKRRHVCFSIWGLDRLSNIPTNLGIRTFYPSPQFCIIILFLSYLCGTLGKPKTTGLLCSTTRWLPSCKQLLSSLCSRVDSPVAPPPSMSVREQRSRRKYDETGGGGGGGGRERHSMKAQEERRGGRTGLAEGKFTHHFWPIFPQKR